MPKQGINRYTIEVRDAQGRQLILTAIDWTDDERDEAFRLILRVAGVKPPVEGPPKPKQPRN
jgi:hypothetical protein